MTHPLRGSAVLCILALAVPPYLAHAQVIPSHAVPGTFGALVMPSFAPALQPCSRERELLGNGAIVDWVVGGMTMLAVGTVAGGMVVGLAEDRSGCASAMLSSRSWPWASLPEHMSVSMRCWNDCLSASDPSQPIGRRAESSRGGPASDRRARADGGASQAFASRVTCTFTTTRQSLP